MQNVEHLRKRRTQNDYVKKEIEMNGNFVVEYDDGHLIESKGNIKIENDHMILELISESIEQLFWNPNTEKNYYMCPSIMKEQNIKRIYGNLNDNKKIILESFLIKNFLNKFNGNNISFHLFIETFNFIIYEGNELSIDSIFQELKKLKEVNLDYSFLNVVKDINIIINQSECLQTITEEKKYIKYTNSQGITCKNINNLHYKISSIYQLLTNQKLYIGEAHSRTNTGTFYFFSFETCSLEKKKYRNNQLIQIDFNCLLKKILVEHRYDSLGALVNNYVLQLNHGTIIENKLMIFVAMIECYYYPQLDNKTAFYKVKKMFNSIPIEIKRRILTAFKNSELANMKPFSKSLEEKLLTMIINNRVYQTHGNDKRKYIISNTNTKQYVLINLFASLIIRIFILSKLELSSDSLINIANKRIEEINDIYIIE